VLKLLPLSKEFDGVPYRRIERPFSKKRKVWGTGGLVCAGTVASSKDISLAPETVNHAGQCRIVARKRLSKPLF
jgi:hypothetical protein